MMLFRGHKVHCDGANAMRSRLGVAMPLSVADSHLRSGGSQKRTFGSARTFVTEAKRIDAGLAWGAWQRGRKKERQMSRETTGIADGKHRCMRTCQPETKTSHWITLHRQERAHQRQQIWLWKQSKQKPLANSGSTTRSHYLLALRLQGHD